MASSEFQISNYQQNSIICLENTKVLDCLYLIKKGQVERLINYYEKEESTILKEGDTFGLISCLTGLVNIERITTRTNCTIVKIPRANLIPFISRKNDVFLKIIQYYSNELRHLDELYFELSGEAGSTANQGMLAEAARYFYKQKQLESCYYAFDSYSHYCNDENAVKLLKESIHYNKQAVPDISDKSEFKKDEIIFLEQEIGKHFYFIDSGKVKISHIFHDKEVILSILSEGEFFGEMALLNRTLRMASAFAFEDCKLMVLNLENFMDSLGHKILQKIFISMATRLYHTFRRVINLHFKNPVARLYDCIDYLIKTKQGVSHEPSFHFYFAMEELKRMANISNVNDSQIRDFLKDDNIRFNYGETVIHDIEEFNLRMRRYTGSAT